MKFSPDDPRLTAYVLGELPETEVNELERELAASPELRQAIDEIRQTVGMLQTELSAEPATRLSAKEKETVLATVGAHERNIIHRSHRSFWRTAGISAIAASILFVIAWQFTHQSPRRSMEVQVADARTQGSSRPAEETELAIPDAAVVIMPPAPAQEPQAKTFATTTAGAILNGTVSSPAKVPVNSTASVNLNMEQPRTYSLAAQSGSKGKQVQANSAYTRRVGGSAPNANYDTFYAQAPGQAGNEWWFEQDGEWRKRERRREIQPTETARYPKYVENSFESVLQQPLSTFSIDVDTASYANVRRFLNEGRMPPHDAVRIEEMINYFSYSYPAPKGDEPFSVNMEVAGCPWQPEHRLLRVGLKGKEVAQDKRPPSNFVFLIDVSGSMEPQQRLPLIKQALRMLVKRMTEKDRIAIVVYASTSGVVLESTSCVNKEKILEALDRLEAGGSTNGGQGIQRAYSLVEEHFIKGGVNRVILCTDGDFNVGITDQSELISLIERKAKSGVFLSALGVGNDNYKDALLQKLADKGNGNYHYIDTLEEAHKVLVQQMNGTLMTIAKDVKIQIEFNPAQVSSYRLIGYEKRILAAEDFNNDKKDAGEIGAGHTVTALYEIIPAGVTVTSTQGRVDALKYQTKPAKELAKRAPVSDSKEMLTLKLRYKKPDGDKSVLREHTLTDKEMKFSQASTDFRFAAAVAGFGMVLKDSEHKGSANFNSVLELAKEAKADDKEGYRAEFINLVKKAKSLKHREE